jgi:hypothetical protein
MPDYENNPLFNDEIIKFDGAVPNISFDYIWDREINRWVPSTGDQINIGSLDIGSVEISDLSDTQTHTLLSSISDKLDGIELGVTIDKDTETHALLSGISGVLEQQEESNDGETHRILSGVSGALNTFSNANEINLGKVEDAVKGLDLGDITITDADLYDEETHRILSGISGQDLANFEESQATLRAIKDNSCNTTLALEELKGNYRDITYHIKKFEEGNILKEVVAFDATEHEELQLIDRVYHKPYKNGRLSDGTISELQQHPLIRESFSNETPERDSVFDEAAPFSFKLENYKGDLSGWHPFFPFDKQLGLDDKITVYNESVFPFEIMFRGGKEFTIYEGHQIELTKEEASQLHVRRKYTISGFEVKYSIERMYTPEQNLKNPEDPHFTNPEQTHSRIGLGSVMMNESHIYISHGNTWKRCAIASWETCAHSKVKSYQIDYFDAYSSDSHLHLNMGEGIRRKLAIASWETCEKVPLECHNNLWADINFIYAKIAEGWKRSPLSEDNQS